MNDRPQFLHQWPNDFYGIVETWRRVVRRIDVIDDIDAADECSVAVDHRDFAMHAAQPVTPKTKAKCLGAINKYFDTTFQ